MSYATLESSAYSAAPVELYEWSFGGSVWRQTSAEVDQTYGGTTWSAVPLSRDEIEDGAELNRSDLIVRAGDDHGVASLFRTGSPEGVILLRLRRMHRADGQTALIWMGRVLNCEFSGIEATLTAEPVTTSLKQTGLRRLYSRMCPHVLYGPACRLSRGSWSASLFVTSVAGQVLSVNGPHAATAGWFAGGMLSWTSGGIVHHRGIETHTVGVIKLLSPLPGLAAGDYVTAYAGCDKSLKTCREKFGNQPNFGGFKWLPTVNPFATSVF